MSSLLQFEGVMSREKGVQLLACLVRKQGYATVDVEKIEGTDLSVLYSFWRKPRDMWGAWVVFEYNGEKHAPDLSVPLSLEKLPRDAVRVPDQAAVRYWLDDGTRECPQYGVCYHRDDERLEKLIRLGIIGKEDLIPGTELPRLYTYEIGTEKDWHGKLELSETIVSFETLPPGAKRISDQAALRCWYEV